MNIVPFARFIAAETATLIGGAITAAAGLASNHMANRARKEESELAYHRAQMERDKQNAYNSPAEQVSRLRAAGLNPNNAYGAEGALTGNQESVPEYSPSDIQSPIAPGTADASSMIDSLVGLREQRNKNVLAESQLLLNGTDMELKQSGVRINDANAKVALELLDLDKEFKSIQIEVSKASKDEIENRSKEIIQRIEESKSKVRLNDAQKESFSVQSLIALALYPSQEEFTRASASERRAMASKVYKESEYIGRYYYLEDERTTALWDQVREMARANGIAEERIEKEIEIAKAQIRQGYWKIGAEVGLGILKTGASLMMPSMWAGNSISQAFVGMMAGQPSNYVSNP